MLGRAPAWHRKGGTVIERRPRFFRTVLLLILLAAPAWSVQLAHAKDGPAPPANLRCEYLSNPLGIDVSQPRFSWVLEHSERGQSQSAYRLLVSTRRDALAPDKGRKVGESGRGRAWTSYG